MNIRFCDGCHKEIEMSDHESYIRLETEMNNYEFDLCKDCRNKMYDSLNWLFKDYGCYFVPILKNEQ